MNCEVPKPRGYLSALPQGASSARVGVLSLIFTTLMQHDLGHSRAHQPALQGAVARTCLKEAALTFSLTPKLRQGKDNWQGSHLELRVSHTSELRPRITAEVWPRV